MTSDGSNRDFSVITIHVQMDMSGRPAPGTTWSDMLNYDRVEIHYGL
jgi:hypothetical protein